MDRLHRYTPFLVAALVAGFGILIVCALMPVGDQLAVFAGDSFNDVVCVVGYALILLAFGRPLASIIREEHATGLTVSFALGRGARRLLIGGLLVAGALLSGCASLDSAAAVRNAYCNGVSTGGRLALAQMATGQPMLLIRCDPSAADAPAPVAVAAPRPAPVAVLAEPIDPLV